jgi:hypothetical protein
MKMDQLRKLAQEAQKLPLEAATANDRAAHGASRPAMITAVRDGVAVHPDGEHIRVRGGADQWAAGLLCRVRDAATMALFGLTDGPIGYLPSSARSEHGHERWRL